MYICFLVFVGMFRHVIVYIVYIDVCNILGEGGMVAYICFLLM